MSTQMKQVKTPEEMGLSGQAVLRFIEKHQDLGIHTLAIARDHKMYAFAVKPFLVDSPHTLFSLSKSFCSIAAGLAVDEGHLRYEDSVAEVLKDSLTEGYDPRLHEVSLHHLLSMSSGLDEESDKASRSKQDWANAALSYRVIHKPGTRFHYNTMGTYLAGRMVSARVGMSLRDYLMPRLFTPLGIDKPQWDCCPLGFNTAGFGLHLSVKDIAKTGQMLLDGGIWGKKRLLSEEYMQRATTKQIENGDKSAPDYHPDWGQGYGYQFWMAQHGRYRGDGMYGQVMMMDVKNNLTLSCTAGLNLMGDEMDALHELMDELLSLPGLDRAGQERLMKKTAHLRVKAPRDKREPLCLEGTYKSADGWIVRMETPDEDSLRLMFFKEGFVEPLWFSFHRKRDHKGYFKPFAPGERPQRTLGRFGVNKGVITAQVIMPEAPYSLRAIITKQDERSMLLDVRSIGFVEGSFTLQRTAP
ncbi:MAG: serine hydrolase [Clostridiales bacterium]|nr:serine hydrolase [Clostridiales bacterium]